MSIISKQLADSQPVGEAQEDPNKDPFLEKPKEGRGITAFLKNSAFDFSAWNIMRLYKILIVLGILGTVILTITLLFFTPGILVKK